MRRLRAIPLFRVSGLAVLLCGLVMELATAATPQLAAGDRHSLALHADGTVLAWGGACAEASGSSCTLDMSADRSVLASLSTGILNRHSATDWRVTELYIAALGIGRSMAAIWWRYSRAMSWSAGWGRG